MLFYPAALPLSRQTLTYTARVIPQAPQADRLTLAQAHPGPAGPAGAGLPAQRRDIRRAGGLVRQAGHAYVIIDGTLIPIDRVAADRPFYSGRHRRHEMNLQVIASPDGDIVWVSGPLPGAVPDLTAARIWGIVRELAASGLVVLADKGYADADEHIRTPYKGRNKPASQKKANRAHAPTPRTLGVSVLLGCCRSRVPCVP